MGPSSTDHTRFPVSIKTRSAGWLLHRDQQAEDPKIPTFDFGERQKPTQEVALSCFLCTCELMTEGEIVIICMPRGRVAQGKSWPGRLSYAKLYLRRLMNNQNQEGERRHHNLSTFRGRSLSRDSSSASAARTPRAPDSIPGRINRHS